MKKQQFNLTETENQFFQDFIGWADQFQNLNLMSKQELISLVIKLSTEKNETL